MRLLWALFAAFWVAFLGAVPAPAAIIGGPLVRDGIEVALNGVELDRTLSIAARSGPRYAAATQLAGPGFYHLTYIISPPSTHGMMRQTDKTGGVPQWRKPIAANYPTSEK